MSGARGRCDTLAKVSRSTRPAKAAPILLFSAALALSSGCGASHHQAAASTPATTGTPATSQAAPAKIATRIEAHVVARVGTTQITDTQLGRLLDENRASLRRRKLPFPATGSTAYRRLRAQALHQLVVAAALERAAARLGIRVTAAQVTKRLNVVKTSYVGIDPEDEEASSAEIDRKFVAKLRAVGMTKDDLRRSLRTQLIMEALYRKVTAHVRPATAAARAAAMQRWTRALNRELARQVEYRRGYEPHPGS